MAEISQYPDPNSDEFIRQLGDVPPSEVMDPQRVESYYREHPPIPVREGQERKPDYFPRLTYRVRRWGSVRIPAREVPLLQCYVGPGAPEIMEDWSSNAFDLIRKSSAGEIAARLEFLKEHGGPHLQARLAGINNNLAEFALSGKCPPYVLVYVGSNKLIKGNPLIDGQPLLAGIGQNFDGNASSIAISAELRMTPSKGDTLIPAYVGEVGPVHAIVTDLGVLALAKAAEIRGRVKPGYVRSLLRNRSHGPFVDIAQYLPQNTPTSTTQR